MKYTLISFLTRYKYRRLRFQNLIILFALAVCKYQAPLRWKEPHFKVILTSTQKEDKLSGLIPILAVKCTLFLKKSCLKLDCYFVRGFWIEEYYFSFILPDIIFHEDMTVFTAVICKLIWDREGWKRFSYSWRNSTALLFELVASAISVLCSVKMNYEGWTDDRRPIHWAKGNFN